MTNRQGELVKQADLPRLDHHVTSDLVDAQLLEEVRGKIDALADVYEAKNYFVLHRQRRHAAAPKNTYNTAYSYFRARKRSSEPLTDWVCL